METYANLFKNFSYLKPFKTVFTTMTWLNLQICKENINIKL